VSEWTLATVRSGGDRLTIRPLGDGEWWVELDGPGMHAEQRIWARNGRDDLDLDEFFAALDAEWRGWEGEKEWSAQGLRLTATHDGLGHVQVIATVDDRLLSGRDDAWSASLRLFLDAGSLGEIARSARALNAP
jgi:hypothetical protein